MKKLSLSDSAVSLKELSPTPAVQASRLETARSIFAQWGDNGLTRLGIRPSCQISFSSDGQACLGYAAAAGAAVALGDPVGPVQSCASLIREFIAERQSEGLAPVFCGLAQASIGQLEQQGFRIWSVGDEALVNPGAVSLQGSEWEETRLVLNRARRLGLRFGWVPPADRSPELLAALREVSRIWLAGKALPELRFAFGDMAALLEPDVRLGIASDGQGRVHGFVSWVPAPASGGWMLELLRKRPTMRRLSGYMVAESLLSFKQEGVPCVSLAGTPLANVAERWPAPLGWILSALCAWLRPVYDYRAVYRFKRKFNPAWRQLYVARPRGMNPLQALAAIVSVSGVSLTPAAFAHTALRLTVARGRARP